MTLPEVKWQHGDDLCDCVFQRVGWWTNPYIGQTMEVRLCCMWDKLIELNPELAQFMRMIPAFDNYNTDTYEMEPRRWDAADHDMPRDIWYRQLATKTGKSLDEIRREYDHLEAPKGVKRPVPDFMPFLRSEAEREGLDITITDVA